MINKIKEFLARNACIKCDYYNSVNGVCQSKKVQTCGCHPCVNWFDRKFCTPYKAESEEQGMAVKGYKVFNEDWTCRDKKYHCPGIFKEDIDKDYLKVCKNGMHFCKNVVDCFSYYMFDTRNHVCEVEALGDVDDGVDKCCTNKLKIIREIPWEEVFTIVNTGCRNTGIGNSGHDNTGHYNSGDYNTGKQNTGNYNKGNNNTGIGNTGDYNTNDFNIGNFNSGRRNDGYNNSGDFNIGNNNTGDYNNGHFNTGGSNTGHYNTGKYNIGNFNSGDFNKADRCSGVFCTKTDKIMMFNKPTDWTYEDWKNSLAYKIILYYMPEEENIYGIGRQDWWKNLKDKDKKAILELPNFDKDIFKEITGIDVGDCENLIKRSENMERNCETCKNYKKDEETGVKSCSNWDCEYEEEEVKNKDRKNRRKN